ncbi:MAG: glycosyl transferase [Gemmatimonadota bacterium]|nr:MAG: glycosyl transferase [Gemmatimonadota bacterium]
MRRRVLLYSHDTVGLGHIRRITAVARSIADRDPDCSILILSGSPLADAHSLPQNVDIIKLPAVRKVLNSRYEARRLGISRDSVLALRAGLIQSTVQEFKPELFIVDKVPMGVHGELRAALDTALGIGCRVVLSLRDILDAPDEVARNWKSENAWEAIRKYYDRVLIWGSPEVFDAVREYDFPADIAAKAEYCGYIAAGEGDEQPALRRPGKRLALATVGGGEDGFQLLHTFVRSLQHTRTRFASVVLMGPDLAEEHRRELRRLVTTCENPVFAVDFTRHVDRLLEAADVVVTMGGYNTLCEVLSRGRRAIVVPRVHPRREQLLRAERFHHLGLVKMIHPEELSPESLALALDHELSDPAREPVNRLDFRGLRRALDVLFPSAEVLDGSGLAAGSQVQR